MSIAALALLVTFAPPDGPTTAVVVATQTDPTLQERILRIKDWNEAVGVTMLDASEVQRRLTGQTTPQVVDLAEMKKRIADAADREARYDSAGALTLREEVLRAYDSSIVPSPELQMLAARALQDIAAAELADGQNKPAQDAARMAQRRFPGVSLDTTRHPPQVEQLFRRAAVDLKRAPLTEVKIISNRPGTVMADNVNLGHIDTTMTRKMPQGTWIMWVSEGDGTSLAHVVTVASTPVTVDIDFALESSLSWTPVPTMRCAAACDVMLRELAKRVGVTEAVGLSVDDDDARQPATGTFVRADDGTVESRPLIALADLNPPPAFLSAEAVVPKPDRFSPWSLVPFGVGQFAQHRYVTGSIFAGAQAGLIAWNVVAAVKHNDFAGADSNHERSLRSQQNVSAALLAGAVVAGVAEAIIWGVRHPKYADGYTPTPPEPTTSADLVPSE